MIDWFTVGAQLLNFVILVWLMKRYLYKPILDAIDAREAKVAAELTDADTKRTEAEHERDRYRKKNEDFDQERAALASKAAEEVEAERQRLLDEAHKAADALRTKQQQALQSDAEHLNKALLQTTQDQVFAIARKALADLATTELEERMAEVFLRRLRALDGDAKAQLADALAAEPAVIKSTFDLGDEQQAAIQSALDETFSKPIRVQFETAPRLIGGIELVAHGQKVAWSIGEYLASLERGVAELVKRDVA